SVRQQSKNRHARGIDIVNDLAGGAARGGLNEDALRGSPSRSTCLQIDANGGSVGIERGIGAWVYVRNLQSAVADLVAGHLARTERSVGRNHVECGVVRPAIGDEVENSDVFARGCGCGSRIDRNA